MGSQCWTIEHNVSIHVFSFTDTSFSTQSAERETFSEKATEYKPDESDMMLWPLSSSEKEIDLRDIGCKFQEIKGSGISVDTDLKSNFSFEEQTESLVARGSGPSRCGSSVSSGSIKASDMNIVLDSTHHIPFKRIPRMLKVAEWLLNMDTACMSKVCEDYQVISSPISREKQVLLTAICKCDSQLMLDQDSGFSRSRRDASEVLLPPDTSHSNNDDDVSKSDLGYRSYSDHTDIDQMTTSSFTSSGRSTMSLKSRECRCHMSECKCFDDMSFFDPLSRRYFRKPITMHMKYLKVGERAKMKRKRIVWDSGSSIGCNVCQRMNVELPMDTCNRHLSSDETLHPLLCFCPRFFP
ncbi:hypothetical protein ACJMK2_012234 [Sinanodonta woodiana]|uniref:Uncharacterized protein n=1 Tax=Sinanodonta woodiana TaxID=1069815 RepID=A0ABD3V7K3_SINWO